MRHVVIGKTDLRECRKCEGLWADAETIRQICSDSERQAAVLGMATVVPAKPIGDMEMNIRYVPCPVCKSLMNRVNFSRCSNVIVDVCSKHGTWFDKEELRRIVEFIRAGGVDKAREKEIGDLERRRRELINAQTASAMGDAMHTSANRYDGAGLGIAVAASVLDALLD